jgi:hypothetical protein
MQYGLFGRLLEFREQEDPAVQAALEEGNAGTTEGDAGQPRRVLHPALEARIAEQQAEPNDGLDGLETPVPAVADPPEPAAQLPASADEGEAVVPPEGEPPDPTTEQRYEIGGRLRTPEEADRDFQHSREEVDKWRQKAIEAEADARAKAQLADALAQQGAPPAEPPPPDPFRERLADAGIEPSELDRYLDQRMESTLAGMGERLNQQRAAQAEAEQRVAATNEGFNRQKLDAFMSERDDLRPAYEAAVAANLESGLALGWNLLSASEGTQQSQGGTEPPAVTPTAPAAPGARKAVSPTQRKVGTPAPGQTKADQQKLNQQAEEEGWDTDSGKRALRNRFGGSLHPGLAQPPS